MKEITCEKIKEKAFFEKLDNGLEIIIVPKKGTNKKYIMFSTHFGSIDNTFVDPKNDEIVKIPDGVAHFLEHKMFEQENGVDSLYTLMALGIDANAYTTNDHTAYLFECTNHFYEGLDELMDYVQHPYFTEQNVEKEKGIIGQEIQMYNDDPGWQGYVNLMDCLYKNNPIKIDIAGSIESISKINPEILNTCYRVFYNHSNMVIGVCGDFQPEEILGEIKQRLVKKDNQKEIRRIYPEEEQEINKKEKEITMPISMPIFFIGYKDKIIKDKKELVKRHIAIEILLNLIIGESSNLYNKLYEEGLLLDTPGLDYECSCEYSHIMISGQSIDPKKIQERIKEEVNILKKEINEEDFNRIKRKIYGNYVSEYNNVDDIVRMFVSDWMKGINSFDYINEFSNVTVEFTKKVLMEVFDDKKMAVSIVKGK